jgi:hypothetical protein
MATLGTYDQTATAGAISFDVASISGGATTYRVLDMAGTEVAAGAVSGSSVSIPAPDEAGWQSGWYLLLLESEAWDTAHGYVREAIQVTVLRDGVAPMPTVPTIGTQPAAQDPNNRGLDLYMHGFSGIGPTRYQIHDAAAPTVSGPGVDQGGSIAAIAANIALERGAAGYHAASYQDTARPRPVIVTFPNDAHTKDGYAAGVTATVQALGPGTPSNVYYFEGLNEPIGQFGLTAAQCAAQFNTFRAAVKAGHPDALAVGPCEVSLSPNNSSLSPQLATLDTFLSTITPGTLDAFSCHEYNGYNGDWTVTDAWLSGARAVLASHGYPAGLPAFLTENGAAGMLDWGLFDPRRAIAWTASLLLSGERYGFPKEHQLWFYDQHLGGDPVTSWLKETSGDLRPYATFFRVYTEETFGTAYASSLDFGTIGNHFFRGNVMHGDGTRIVLMAQGNPQDTVTLGNLPAGTVTATTWDGHANSIPVTAGQAVIPIGSLPTYVRIAGTVTPTVVDAGGGVNGNPENIAPVAAIATGYPDDDDPGRMTDEQWRTGGYLPSPDTVFSSPSVPGHVTLEWDAPVTIDRVLIRQLAPWVNSPPGCASAMLEGNLEYWNGSGWLPCPTVAQAHWDDRGGYLNDTAQSFLGKVGETPCKVSFYDQQWCHNIGLRVPVTTTKIRMRVKRTTVGSIPDYSALVHAPYGLVDLGDQRLVISQIAVLAHDGGPLPTVAPFARTI